MNAVINTSADFAEAAQDVDYWRWQYEHGLNFGDMPNEGVLILIEEMERCGVAIEQAHVLDIGSGPNDRNTRLFTGYPQARIVAVDPAVDLTVIRTLYPNYAKLIYNGKVLSVSSPFLALPELRQSFNVAMLVRGPHLFTKDMRKLTFTKVHDHLGRGALFLVVSRSPEDFNGDLMVWTGNRREPGEVEYIDGNRKGQKIRLLTRAQMSSELKGVGFRVVRTFSGCERENSLSERITCFDGVIAMKPS